MRAIDKGGSPYKEIDEYQDAIPYLEKKIGLYCSYCEMSIKHVPEVEHKISRKNGGDWTAWSNLLLGCKYCNTRKAAKITPQNVGEYLWPDSDNTAVAFSYTNGIPKVNEDILSALDPTGICCEKAKNTYEMVATVYKGNIIKNLIMDCQSYTKYRPNETTGGIFVSWRRKEELPTGA